MTRGWRGSGTPREGRQGRQGRRRGGREVRDGGGQGPRERVDRVDEGAAGRSAMEGVRDPERGSTGSTKGRQGGPRWRGSGTPRHDGVDERSSSSALTVNCSDEASGVYVGDGGRTGPSRGGAAQRRGVVMRNQAYLAREVVHMGTTERSARLLRVPHGSG